MVLYEPDWKITGNAIRSLASQVDKLCIVDNTPDSDNSSRLVEYNNVHYIPLKTNKGIASAQNIGIKYLQDNEFPFILFSDQDTEAPDDIVAGLLKDFFLLSDNGYNVGLIGPMPINKKTQKPYENKVRSVKEFVCGNKLFIESRYIISSFSLIPVENFNKVGYYYEDFFIDFVENEWCFRLKSRLSLSAYISCGLKIQHELGASGTFLGKQISISSPFRLYYQIRNYFWIRKLDYLYPQWIEQVRRKLILKLIYYPIVPTNRISYLRSIFRGLKDGIKSKPDFLPKKPESSRCRERHRHN